MRPGGQNGKRMRGRNNNRHKSGGGSGGGNPLGRSYESNGPDVKIRGSAQHIAEKYSQLARDSHAAGDHVLAENYLQHAEHYFRMIAAYQAQFAPQGEQGEQNFDANSDSEDGDFEGPGEGEAAYNNRRFRTNEQQQNRGGDNRGNDSRGNDFRGENRSHEPRDNNRYERPRYQAQPRPESVDQPSVAFPVRDETLPNAQPQGERPQGERPQRRFGRDRYQSRDQRPQGDEAPASDAPAPSAEPAAELPSFITRTRRRTKTSDENKDSANNNGEVPPASEA